MDSFAIQMTQDIEKNLEISSNITNNLKKQLQVVEDGVSSDSALFKQLITTQQTCGSLHEKLDAVGPGFGNLTVSIRNLEGQEINLSGQIEEFAKRLSEIQLRAQEVSQASEASNRSAEDSAIWLQLQEISAELRLVEERLKAKETENENIKLSLLEATEKVQEAEGKATQLEAEKSELHDKIQFIESKVREELNRASVIARDQNKAKFEQQIHKLVREKMDIEKDAERMKEQLERAKKSLVRSILNKYLLVY